MVKKIQDKNNKKKATPDFKQQVELLRLRFLEMDFSDLREFLWDEHPQVAIFLLNWLNHPVLFQAFLSPLPVEQQVDLIYRQAYIRFNNCDPHQFLGYLGMDKNQTLGMLLSFYRKISPEGNPFGEIRERSSDPDSETVLLQEDLLHYYINNLSEEVYKEIRPYLDDLDICLSRILYSSRLYQNLDETHQTSITVRTHGFFNIFADFMNTGFNRVVNGQFNIFTESVIAVEKNTLKEELKSNLTCIRARDKKTQSFFYLFLDYPLKSLILDTFFGANTVYQPVIQVDPVGSPIEKETLLWVAEKIFSYLESSAQPLIELSLEQPEFYSFASPRFEVTQGVGPSILATILLEGKSSGVGALRVLLEHEAVEFIYKKLGEENLLREVVKNLEEIPPFQTENTADNLEGELQKIVTELFSFEEKKEVNLFANEERVEGILWDFILKDLESNIAVLQSDDPLDLLIKGGDVKKKMAQQDHNHENTNYAEIHYNYGVAFLKKGLWREAKNALETALRFNPSCSCEIYLAIANGQAGEYLLELTAYKKILAQFPKLREVYVLLARRFSSLNKPGEALKSLKNAINLGFSQLTFLEKDPCFESLLSSSQWKKYRSKHEF